jgi:uncharacterized protein YfaS (alpha-2-macroglobulin family)
MLWAEARFSACFAAHCHPRSLPRRAIADAKIDSFETPLAHAHLAAALALLGDRPRAEAVFAKATERLSTLGNPLYSIPDYGSRLRGRWCH